MGAGLLGPAAGGASAQLFTDVSVSAGVGGEVYISSAGHGLGALWIDCDEDGWPDLFTTNGKDLDAHLYHNSGDGTFADADELLPPLPDYELMGAVYADIENDGDSDIYVFTDHESAILFFSSNPADGPPNLLLVNRFAENGNRLLLDQSLFEERAAAAGVDDLAPLPFGPTYPAYRSTTGAFLDYDVDGFVDLYVGHWYLNHPFTEPNADRLFHNEGDGTFTDVTAEAGLYPGGDTSLMRPALAMVAAHLDGDLRPDIYVGNAQSSALGSPPNYHTDNLLRNTGGGRFLEAAGDSPGVGDDAQSAMGVAVADVDLDRDWDIYVSDIYNLAVNFDSLPLGNPLYLGNGDGTFSDNVAPDHGVAGIFSWGVSFFDYDHDGYEDLFVGAVTPTYLNKLYHNNGDGYFTDVSASSGTNGVPSSVLTIGSRGSAVADYDGDGDLDLVSMNQGARLSLFRNDAPKAGHWLKVDLQATQSNRDAIGAMVVIAAGGKEHRRQVMGGTSVHGQDSLQLHFGLGASTQADLLTVFWPSGLVNTLEAVPADTTVTVVEAPQSIAMYGTGASGPTSVYAPALIASGQTGSGQTLNVNLRSALGGAQVFYLLGLSTADSVLGNGLPLLVGDVLAVLGPFPVFGSGVGKGSLDLGFPVPPGLPAGLSATLQAFITSLPGEVKAPSASNGVLLTF